jgi:hypothetical protein
MGDSHSKSFFGQNTGLILNSSSKNEPFFFVRCIKRKPDGIWEKPSKREGKVIKFSMEESIMILQVLNRKLLNWSSYHTYKDNKTSISFNWEDEKAKVLWINLGNYSKMLNFAQAEILKLLIAHILKEKIEFATISNRGGSYKNKQTTNQLNNINNSNEDTEFKEVYSNDLLEEFDDYSFNTNKVVPSVKNKEKESNNKRSQINGTIKGETEKALLLNFNSGQELWIPKSTIHSKYQQKKDLDQKFLIDNWILKKNKITS